MASSLQNSNSNLTAEEYEEYKKELIVEYWFRVSREQQIECISINFILPMIIEYAKMLKILRFDSTLKSKAIQLLDDDKCAIKSITGQCHGHIYVLGDTEPVRSGIHVWRAHVEHTHSEYI